MVLKRCHFFVAFITLSLGLGCSSGSESTPQGETCPEGHLENVVYASDWAQQRTGVVTYRYLADIQGGFADVELLDARDEVLSTMRVRQLFGDENEPDGVMEAVLTAADADSLRLVTRGEDVDEEGYTVVMRLERSGQPTLHLTAQMQTVTCWLEEPPVVAPPCAFGLPLDEPGFSLPSCGLILDDRIRTRQPPQLTHLSYAVAAEESDGVPSLGSVKRDANRAFHRLDVLDSSGITPGEDVEQWLGETGGDALVGTEAERLLTTAFLDRSWWRILNEHVAHCDLERLPRPGGSTDVEQDETRTVTMSLCPGDQNNNDWGSGNDGTKATTWGDPHLVSFDGYGFDLQAAGEYVLFETIAGDPIVVQGRFEPLDSNVPGCGDLSWNTAAATEIGGHRISARSQPEFEIYIDGELVTGTDDVPELEDGASITLGQTEVNLRWPGGERVDFIRSGSGGTSSLTVEAELPPSRGGQVRGIFGQFDSDDSNDLVLSDGRVLDRPASFEELYEQFAEGWRIPEEESLFDYIDAEGPGSFDVPGFPAAPVRVNELPADQAADAEEDCLDEGVADAHLLAACIIDIVCLNDSDYAEAAVGAPKPSSSQPPGRHDLVVDGAVRHTNSPEVVVAEPEPEPAQCRPRSAPRIALFDEHDSISLPDDVEADISSPGAYDVGSSMSSTTLGSGTDVAVYHLTRRVPDSPEQRHAGSVRFAQPILGVIVDSDALGATDGVLGNSDTEYRSEGFAGLRSEGDLLEISEDARTLDIVWTGDGAHRIRVLVDATN